MATQSLKNPILHNRPDLHPNVTKEQMEEMKVIDFDYDNEDGADVLYLTFQESYNITYSFQTDNWIIVRFENGTLVVITVLHASKRTKDEIWQTYLEVKDLGNKEFKEAGIG